MSSLGRGNASGGGQPPQQNQRCQWCARPIYFTFGKWYHWKAGYWCFDNNGKRRAPSPLITDAKPEEKP